MVKGFSVEGWMGQQHRGEKNNYFRLIIKCSIRKSISRDKIGHTCHFCCKITLLLLLLLSRLSRVRLCVTP